jgi:hypothetical protein
MGDYIMSTIKANDIQNASGGIPTVKGQRLIPTAWVNFNGTGTIAIRDSEGVSSLTDNGTGNYTVTFTSAMANTNYVALTGAGQVGSASGNGASVNTPTVNSLNYYSTLTGSQAATDKDWCNVTIMGGQA